MADEDRIAPIESRAVVELVDALRQSYSEAFDEGDRLGLIARWECRECAAEEGDLHSVYCGLGRRNQRVNRRVAVKVEYVRADVHEGAVSALRHIAESAEHPSLTVRSTDYLGHVARSWLKENGYPTSRGQRQAPGLDATLNVLARVIENRHGTLPGIGDTLREALAEIERER